MTRYNQILAKDLQFVRMVINGVSYWRVYAVGVKFPAQERADYIINMFLSLEEIMDTKTESLDDDEFKDFVAYLKVANKDLIYCPNDHLFRKATAGSDFDGDHLNNYEEKSFVAIAIDVKASEGQFITNAEDKKAGKFNDNSKGLLV